MKIVSLLLLSQTKAFQMPTPKTTSVRLNLSASTEALTPAINVINELNGEIEPKLEMLREKPYFRLYSVDMLGSCEYMPQELFECYSETCEIYPVDEEEVSQNETFGYVSRDTRFSSHSLLLYLTSLP